jgi:hypothetical protein
MMQEFYPAFLVERPATQRVWVVRASGGQFVQHFKKFGLVAIGHLNDLTLENGTIANVSALNFESALRIADKDRSKASITSHVKQVEAFCSNINKDDLVVTIDSSALMIGRVTGDAYIDKSPLVIHYSDGFKHEMQHKLRRAVSWGPLISRKSVPVAMEMTLFAHQTVFNIDRYWTSVYHLLYPCFTFEGKLYLSANIKQQEDIDNYSVSQLFSLLSGVEVMAKLMAKDSTQWQSYPENLPELREELKLSLSSKAEFMSPGTVWSALALEPTSLIYAAVIYVMLFGGDLKFFKADGLIDTHTRQKIWDRILKLKKTHDVEKITKQLKVEVPKLDTEPLQVPAQKEKRTRKKSAIVNASDAENNSSSN